MRWLWSGVLCIVVDFSHFTNADVYVHWATSGNDINIALTCSGCGWIGFGPTNPSATSSNKMEDSDTVIGFGSTIRIDAPSKGGYASFTTVSGVTLRDTSIETVSGIVCGCI